ncbi:4'-phosphopantetheinyl transferase family protein [Pseudomonas sp. LRF_L74]|uniref:4'-phosphopantetheinyl transferase family protein n=1 Tax=Pseudomonas sp. LRF_L74 TaxID=3369422 RepID=UPI003F616863
MTPPAFFTLLTTPTQAPLVLPGTQLVCAAFDLSRLHPDDFQNVGIAPVRGVAKRQSEYLAGRLCAHEALHRLAGLDSFPARGEDGAPQWPTGVSGSISHGAGLAAALVANDSHWRGLGLDLETPLGADRAARLASEILTADEMQRARHLDPQAFALRVTQTFSLKESLFKALYPLVLKRFYFEDAELIECSADGNARLRLLIDLSEEWRSGSELDGRFATYQEHLLSLVAVPA